MTKSPLVGDPSHWQRRAEEARRIADQLDDPIAKQTMREIAISYERLAALARSKLTDKSTP